MKSLYKFQLSSYFGPFIATFCISLFVLLMQFVFTYIDDLIGKGLELYIIAKLLLYVSATLIPMALPLAILLSSLMTYGNLAENYELVAMKSAGMSLRKIMLPLTIVSIMTSLGAFYFSNNMLPWANLKMNALLFDVRQSKPTIAFKAGAFYNGIRGYSIRIGHKESDGKTMRNLIIYDHSEMLGNNKVIFADSAVMEMSANKELLIIKLKNGNSYEEPLKNEESVRKRPLMHSTFKEEVLQIDISDLKMSRTDESLFKHNYQMMNLSQLKQELDSISLQYENKPEEVAQSLKTNYYSRSLQYMHVRDSVKKESVGNADFYTGLSTVQKINTLETAMNIARSAKSYLETTIESNKEDRTSIYRYEVEMHRKFTLSIACFILFFIGAPLGAIIRKGGLGMPVVISVVFFLLFYIISIIGERFAKEGVIPVYQGMWIAPLVLFPIGIFLTYKASADSSLFDTDAYLQSFKKIFRIKSDTHA